jgi:hypothetical protein
MAIAKYKRQLEREKNQSIENYLKTESESEHESEMSDEEIIERSY